MVILKEKFIVIIFAFLLPGSVSYSQKSDKIILSTDSASGIRKTIYWEFEGISYGIDGGSAPKLTKRTITKEDKSGKIIYLSHRTTNLNGCIRTINRWDIISYEASGAYHTFNLRESKGLVVRNYDRGGKLVSKLKPKYAKPEKWMDMSEFE